MTDAYMNIRYYMHGTTDTCTISDQTVTDDQVEFISSNLPASVTTLNLSRTVLTEIGIGYLATNLLLRGRNNQVNLKSLSLSNTKLTDGGVRLLCRALIDGRNTKLQHLSICINGQITQVGAHEIAQMLEVNEGLEVLDLSYTSIGRQGVFELCRVLVLKKDATLKCLDISCTLTLEEKNNDRPLNELLEKVSQRVNILNY